MYNTYINIYIDYRLMAPIFCTFIQKIASNTILLLSLGSTSVENIN